MSLQAETLFKEHFRETRRQLRALWFKVWGGGSVVVLIGFCAAWFFIQPAPPRDIHMAAGSPDGAYFQFARAYAEELAKHGITLHLHETQGSPENFEALQTDPLIDLAIVQGGTTTGDHSTDLGIESLASLYLEPVWVFYRGPETVTELRALQGKRIAVGRPKSGTAMLAMMLLEENGISPESDNLLPIGGRESIDQLLEETIDAAFFVTSPNASAIRSLAQNSDVRLMDFDRHTAYTRRHPFLSSVSLAEGVIDLEKNYPSSKVDLIAPATNLIATSQLHDSLIPMLLRAADIVHAKYPSIVQDDQLPSTQFIEFPLNESARLYFENGPPFLQKYLPFWVASFCDRGAILLLPALTLLLPLFRIAPPLYRWRIRSRIYRWYNILRGMEADLQGEVDTKKLGSNWQTLQIMEAELDDLHNVPLAYMQEFYSLRLHIEFVERRVLRRLKSSGVALEHFEPDAENHAPTNPGDSANANAPVPNAAAANAEQPPSPIASKIATDSSGMADTGSDDGSTTQQLS